MDTKSFIQLLKKMFINAANNLENKKIMIDNLNVFPVPDGDTGTNMSLTMNSSASAIKNGEFDTLFELGKSLANGALMGARGNSGVILSQLISGFAEGLEGKDKLDNEVMLKSLTLGVKAAYNAVSNPVEGTILTVSREAVKGLEVDEDLAIEDFMQKIINQAKESLERTPELLPVLKQSGVVDAGGAGFVIFLEGIYEALIGNDVPLKLEKHDEAELEDVTDEKNHFFVDVGDIKFQYCTELFLNLEKSASFDLDAAKKYLHGLGDSELVVHSGDLVKVHVHTNEPWNVLKYFGQQGYLTGLKIDNMKAQNMELQEKMSEEERELGIIAVSYGAGLNSIFTSLGANYIINGGQTMNPSTEDILKATQKINAKEYLILPNNKNIIMAAEQAAEISDNKIHVVKSKTLPQGITSLMEFNSEASMEENMGNMSDSLDYVKTLEITYAVRDALHDDLEIKAGEFMAVLEGKIKKVGADLKEVVLEGIKQAVDDESEIVTLYYGEDVPLEEAERLINELADIYDEIDFELHYGGQPLYYYVISVE